MSNCALITGINSQDGSYLAELLLSKGYCVYGTLRTESYKNCHNLINLENILDKITLLEWNISDKDTISKIIAEIKPDECYHLAASVELAEDDVSIIDYNYNSTAYVLSAIKNLSEHTKLFFAGSSEMFGNAQNYPQNENTSFNPRNMYGITKLSSYYTINYFREKYELYACTGITYNHESKRRGKKYVTRKITSGVADIVRGNTDHIELGNLNTAKDWGYAPDYVQAMHMMLNNPKGPVDYVISTGILHTINDVVKTAFSVAGLDPNEFIRVNSNFDHTIDKVPLIGDSSKIRADLDWHPKKKFEDIITEMTLYDLKH